MYNGINVLSLFDGISCGRIALERSGVKINTYFSSEIDKSSIIVSQKNYPDNILLGDIRNITINDLPKIDLLIGGSPCQNFSFAGNIKGMITKDNIEITSLEQYIDLKNKGFEFSGQSYLFFEYLRLLRQTQPKYFLLENVKMLKKWEDVITGYLGVEPILINSNLVSAQNRKRLYWTNIPGIKLPKDKNILLKDILECGDIDGLNIRSKSKCVRSGGRLSVDRHEWDSVDTEHKRKLSILECERLQTLPDNYTNYVPVSKRYKMIGNGWTVDVISHIFNSLDF